MPANGYDTVMAALPADRIAQVIAVPRLHAPQRLPSFPNLERTAVVSTMSQNTVSVDQTRVMMLCRSPVHPAWIGEIQTTPQTWSVFLLSDPARSQTFASGTILFDDTWVGISAEGSPPQSFANDFQTYPLGTLENGDLYLMRPVGMSAQLSLTTSSAVTISSCRITVATFDGVQVQSRITTFIAGTAATNFSIPLNVGEPALGVGGASWFRVQSLDIAFNTATTLTGYLMGATTNGSLLAPTASLSTTVITYFRPVMPVPEFRVSEIPYSSVRQNASSLLATNVTAVLSKEGTVLAARVPRATMDSARENLWDPTVCQTSTLILSAAPQEKYFGPLEKGIYSYTLPDAASERFRDCTSDVAVYSGTTSTGVKMPLFPLEGFDYLSFFVMHDYYTTTVTTLLLTVDSHLEFRTNSALFPLGFSSTLLESYHVAQMALARSGVFFENPTHLSAIVSMMRTAVRQLAPYAVTAGKALIRAAVPKAVEVGNKAVSKILQATAPAPTVNVNINKKPVAVPAQKSNNKQTSKPPPKSAKTGGKGK